MDLAAVEELCLAFRFCLVFETGSLSHDAEECGGCPAGAVHALLPFADGLLAGAQLISHFTLGQAQMRAECMNALAIPLPSASSLCTTHALIVHESV